ncbi:hypothetical protein EM69_003969 [Salmonella enterica subsp. enterica serovar Typhimurium]|uniref:Uncharacterized protein n=1 Tax=Salmonella phage Stitch TaxID=2991861 RepID=A0A0A0RWC3_9CAUD|nr:hypothetical protein CPT_Stitch27 [Salmonella phage Stitch]AIW03978.1 hypothetical protein CPT_Stitch27 [Salmonella phage Stitch]EDV2866248.1 hypothetical protein [Salmonella enterica subsp. enterica serovar Typhimurium]QCQ65350.1 hypothetical protein CPT_Seabear_034 [Salmonella phage Seabear]
MTNGKFLLVLGLNALVSLAITLGVSDFMLNQPEKKEALEQVYISPEVKEQAKRNKMLAEANLVLNQAEFDIALSKYSGAEVKDAHVMKDLEEIKHQIEEAKRFCKSIDQSLEKITFYRTISPYIECGNGVFK